MEYEIHARGTGENSAFTKRLTVEAASWFDALVLGLRGMHLTVHAKKMGVSLYEDGVSACIDLPDDALKIDVIAPDATVQNGILDVFRLPMPHPDMALSTLSPGGSYSPGDTVQHLTSSFMKLAELHTNYGDDICEAVTYVMKFAERTLGCEGGGVYLRDLDDPLAPISCVVASGPHKAELERPIEWGRGAVGRCADDGKAVNESAVSDGLFGEPINGIGPVMCTPIRQHGERQGVFAIYESAGSEAFTGGQLEILGHISQAVGYYLDLVGPESHP